MNSASQRPILTFQRMVVLDVKPGTHMESQSGIQMLNPRIYGRLEGPTSGRGVAYIVIHPSNNFLGHYLIEPLRDRGRTILALNTRYLGNDTMLIMERAIQDLGAGVRFLRHQGFQKIVLIGNSGGGSLVAFYQQQAEKITIRATPDGRNIDLCADDLPRADAIALLCAHPGRARTLTDMMDPSVLNENSASLVDSDLDMFDSRNGPPYEREWLLKYRSAQRARNERLTEYALTRIRECDADKQSTIRDLPMIIHRTMADPRNLDLTIDPNDRQIGSIWGDAKTINYAPNGTARFCTLRSFLSQWSLQCSRADGPKCLASTSVPVLSMNYTADQIVFPSQIGDWVGAATGRCTELEIRNAGHYPQSDARMVHDIADRLVDWGG